MDFSVGGNGAQLVALNIKAPKNGYTYMYVSNQSDQDVYFDNLQVGIAAGNIIEENHYYAYGLKIAGISSKKLGDPNDGSLKNNNLYNDKEIDDEADLNWLDYGFRNYDAQIGRFVQLDPLTDETPALSGYHYALNDPITNIDEDGLSGIPCPGASMVSIFVERSAQAIGSFSSFVLSLGVNGLKIAGEYGQQRSTGNQINNALNGKSVQQVGDGEKFSLQQLRQKPDDFDNWSGYDKGYYKVFGQKPPKYKTPKDKRRGVKNVFNIDNAVSTLDDNAYAEYDKNTCGKCAKKVRIALSSGGINTDDRPESAKDYGSYLIRWGFKETNTENYTPVKGDIRVFQPYTGGSKHGHIDMYNGKQWVSDFRESGAWPGRGYSKNPNYQIFRWSP